MSGATSASNLSEQFKNCWKSIAIRAYQFLLWIGARHRRLLYLASSPRLLQSEQHPYLYFAELRAEGSTYRMALSRPGAIEDTLIQEGDWEPQLRSLILFFLKPNGIFLDIGANIGTHTLYVAASRKDCECLCFEPCPDIYAQLTRNIRLSRLSNVTAYDIAAGDKMGDVDFFAQTKSAYNRGLSSVQKNFDLMENVERISVHQMDLDSFLDDTKKEKISVIKIDTQGSELAVLRGLRTTIAKFKPVVIFEFVSDYLEAPSSEIFEILQLLPNYDIFKVHQNFPETEVFSPEEVRQKGFWSDLICLPTGTL